MASNDTSSLFNSGVSPPLILALLAVFFFVAAIFTFAWRRRRYGALDGGTLGGALGDGMDSIWAVGPWERDGAGAGRSGRGVNVGERPKLWEYWIRDDGRILEKEVVSWEDAKPLAAAPILESDYASKPIHQPKNAQKVASPAKGAVHPSKLQVSFAIAFPHAKNHLFTRPASEDGLPPFEYCIGVSTVRFVRDEDEDEESDESG